MVQISQDVSGGEARTGRLVVVLGPSGSGKDTLMSFARAELADVADVLFVQRSITRPADAGNEDHIAMSDGEFDQALEAGQFSLSWSANGLRYGLPRSVEEDLAQGRVAVVNGSRGALDVLREVFPTAMIVEIRVDPEILAKRLIARGRESHAEIQARLVRAKALETGFEADVVIDNSGAVEDAGRALVECIKSAIKM